MTIEEYAAARGVSGQTVRRWIKKGLIQAKAIGRTWDVTGDPPEIRIGKQEGPAAKRYGLLAASQAPAAADTSANVQGLIDALQALLDVLVENGGLKLREWRGVTLRLDAMRAKPLAAGGSNDPKGND